MLVTTTDNLRERTALTGMIVSTPVLARLTPKYHEKLFASRYSNIIAKWCIDHYHRYDEAPQKLIMNYYEQWSIKNNDKSTDQIISSYLESISDEYASSDGINVEHVLAEAESHFNAVMLRKTIDALTADALTDDFDQALVRMNNFNKFDLKGDEGSNLIHEDEEIEEAFRENGNELLVEYGGALGNLFRDAFSRDAFVAITAPEKTGKTWMLIDIAWRAMLERRRVSFFEVGDMTRKQIKRRFYSRVAAHPYRSETGEWPFVVKKPVKLTMTKDGPLVERKPLAFNEPLNFQLAKAACEKVTKEKLKSNKSHFKLTVRSNSSINVMGIRSILETQKREKFVPDVVVIDYADILADPIPGNTDYRQQINTTWKQLRQLSQDFHCLVVTATQADADAYDKKTLTIRNFSEDKRKNSHVTAMIGLNVTQKDKQNGVMRINVLHRREGECDPWRTVTVAGCLAIGQPCILSSL